jgi:hypothetical protein
MLKYKMPVAKGRGTGRGRGRGRGGARTTGTQTMKKVSKKGAYKKGVKNQMILRRAPLVETLQRTSSIVAGRNGHGVTVMPETQDPFGVQSYLMDGDPQQPLNWRIVPNDDAFFNMPLSSFLRNQRGLRTDEFTGDQLTAKWLNTRLEVKFPSGEVIPISSGSSDNFRNMMIQDNYKVYAIWGYVTSPLHAPVADESGDRKVISEITQQDLTDHIISQIKPYFDDNYDPLSFTPKATTNMKIEKYIRLKPPLSTTVGTQAVPITGVINDEGTMLPVPPHGSIPNVMRTFDFKMNRKIHYEEGKQPDGSEPDKENNFPNNAWLPFMVLYCPNFDVANAQENYLAPGTTPTNPQNKYTYIANERRRQHLFVRWNDQLNYTDS